MRTGNKWTVNEILSLQRNYELLEMDVHDIAKKHDRSVASIISKLFKEGFIESMDQACGLKGKRQTRYSLRPLIKRVV
jgi:hypothetical protein